jgi:hypothetical protein
MFQCATSSYGGPSVSPHAVFWTVVGKSFGRCAAKIQAQIDGVSSHKSSSNAAEPFHVLDMNPMSDVSMCNQLLVAHLCCPTPCFGLRLGTVLAGEGSKSVPRVMVFPATTPHQMLLNHFISSSIWIQ